MNKPEGDMCSFNTKNEEVELKITDKAKNIHPKNAKKEAPRFIYGEEFLATFKKKLDYLIYVCIINSWKNI